MPTDRGGPTSNRSPTTLRAALGLAAARPRARLARSLGHLSFARRFLRSRGHYVHAAECTADPAGRPRTSGQRQHRADRESRQFRYEYVVAAAARAAAAGDPGTQAAVLPSGVGGESLPGDVRREIELDELLPVLEIARTIAPPERPSGDGSAGPRPRGPDQHPAGRGARCRAVHNSRSRSADGPTIRC